MFDSTFCCLVRACLLTLIHTHTRHRPSCLVAGCALAVPLGCVGSLWVSACVHVFLSMCVCWWVRGVYPMPTSPTPSIPLWSSHMHRERLTHNMHPSLYKAADDVPSSCIFITVMMSTPAKRPATRVTSAPVSVATAILPNSARQPAKDQGATTGGRRKNNKKERMKVRHCYK